jgi:hypothetical protein
LKPMSIDRLLGWLVVLAGGALLLWLMVTHW